MRQSGGEQDNVRPELKAESSAGTGTGVALRDQFASKFFAADAFKDYGISDWRNSAKVGFEFDADTALPSVVLNLTTLPTSLLAHADSPMVREKAAYDRLREQLREDAKVDFERSAELLEPQIAEWRKKSPRSLADATRGEELECHLYDAASGEPLDVGAIVAAMSVLHGDREKVLKPYDPQEDESPSIRARKLADVEAKQDAVGCVDQFAELLRAELATGLTDTLDDLRISREDAERFVAYVEGREKLPGGTVRELSRSTFEYNAAVQSNITGPYLRLAEQSNRHYMTMCRVALKALASGRGRMYPDSAKAHPAGALSTEDERHISPAGNAYDPAATRYLELRDTLQELEGRGNQQNIEHSLGTLYTHNKRVLLTPDGELRPLDSGAEGQPIDISIVVSPWASEETRGRSLDHERWAALQRHTHLGNSRYALVQQWLGEMIAPFTIATAACSSTHMGVPKPMHSCRGKAFAAAVDTMEKRFGFVSDGYQGLKKEYDNEGKMILSQHFESAHKTALTTTFKPSDGFPEPLGNLNSKSKQGWPFVRIIVGIRRDADGAPVLVDGEPQYDVWTEHREMGTAASSLDRLASCAYLDGLMAGMPEYIKERTGVDVYALYDAHVEGIEAAKARFAEGSAELDAALEENVARSSAALDKVMPHAEIARNFEKTSTFSLIAEGVRLPGHEEEMSMQEASSILAEIARRGLERLGADPEDINRYMGVIERRATTPIFSHQLMHGMNVENAARYETGWSEGRISQEIVFRLYEAEAQARSTVLGETVSHPYELIRNKEVRELVALEEARIRDMLVTLDERQPEGLSAVEFAAKIFNNDQVNGDDVNIFVDFARRREEALRASRGQDLH